MPGCIPWDYGRLTDRMLIRWIKRFGLRHIRTHQRLSDKVAGRMNRLELNRRLMKVGVFSNSTLLTRQYIGSQ